MLRHQDKSHYNNPHSSPPDSVSALLTTVKTFGLASVGTAALVALHHQYRKRYHHDAHLQDYVQGAKAELKRLHRANTHAIHSAQQSWLTAWQQPQPNDKKARDKEAKKEAQNNELQADSNVYSQAQSFHQNRPVSNAPVVWVSGVAELSKGEFAVVGIAANANKEIVWQTPMPERVHDIVVQPIIADKSDAHSHTQTSLHTQEKLHTQPHTDQHVVVMGRRPSERFWVLSVQSGAVLWRIQAASQRHFYGHACYSLDGQTLYVTENDTVSLTGKIGVYAVNKGYKKVAEFASHGIGPHELLAHPDGNTLVIANGGIKTEKASREELNLESMQPSLVYLDRHNGALLEQVYPEHNQMSVRHLSLHPDGLVAIGIQFQGERHLNIPLVLTHRRGDAKFEPLTMPHGQWQRFHHYIASVAVNAGENLLCASSPIGGCAAVYDLNSRQLIASVKLPDCAGVAVALGQNMMGAEGFIVSDGQGNLTHLHVDEGGINHQQNEQTEQNIIALSSDPLHMTQVRHALAFDNQLQAVAYPATFYALLADFNPNQSAL